MLPTTIKDRHYRKAHKLCEKHVKEVRSPELVEKPLLSVLFLTYNHEPFVRQALDSVLMQKTSFPFEVVISDDCSTDGTREIVQEYHEKHPDKIRLLLSDKNLWNFRGNGHGSAIFLNLFKAGYRSKYNALLEGDDYWTRDDKLQIQVDYLENHPDVGICGHLVRIQSNNKKEDGRVLGTGSGHKFTSYDVLTGKNERMHTSSIVYRTSSFNIKVFMRYLQSAGDNTLFYSITKKYDAFTFNERMSVYRYHESGVWCKAQTHYKILITLLEHYNSIKMTDLNRNKELTIKRNSIIVKYQRQLRIYTENMRLMETMKAYFIDILYFAIYGASWAQVAYVYRTKLGGFLQDRRSVFCFISNEFSIIFLLILILIYPALKLISVKY